MPWTLHLQPIRNPWTDAALLAGGRALYVAQAYEEKCKTLLRFGHLVEGIQADPVAGLDDLIRALPKDRMLKETLDRLAHILPSAAEHAQVLQKAREARNFIAHEGVRFSIDDSQASDLLDRLRGLRAQVQLLASGDNLVSAWLFNVEEPYELLPRWLIDSYNSMIDEWVFAPVWELVSTSDE
jgi:hypothetical protein